MSWYQVGRSEGPIHHRGTVARGRLQMDCQLSVAASSAVMLMGPPDPQRMCPECGGVVSAATPPMADPDEQRWSDQRRVAVSQPSGLAVAVLLSMFALIALAMGASIALQAGTGVVITVLAMGGGVSAAVLVWLALQQRRR